MIKSKTNKTKYLILSTITLLLSMVALLIGLQFNNKAYADNGIVEDGFLGKKDIYYYYTKIEIPTYKDGTLQYLGQTSTIYFNSKTDFETYTNDAQTFYDYAINHQSVLNKYNYIYNGSEYFELSDVEYLKTEENIIHNFTYNKIFNFKTFKAIYEPVNPESLISVKINVPIYLDGKYIYSPDSMITQDEYIKQIPQGVNLYEFIKNDYDWKQFLTIREYVDCSYVEGGHYHEIPLDHIEPAVVTQTTDCYKLVYNDTTHQQASDLKYNLLLPNFYSNNNFSYTNDEMIVYTTSALDTQSDFITAEDFLKVATSYGDNNNNTTFFKPLKIDVQNTNCGCQYHYFDFVGLEKIGYTINFNKYLATYKVIVANEQHELSINYKDSSGNTKISYTYFPVDGNDNIFDNFDYLKNDVFKVKDIYHLIKKPNGYYDVDYTFPFEVNTNLSATIVYEDFKIPMEIRTLTNKGYTTKKTTFDLSPSQIYDGKIHITYYNEYSFLKYNTGAVSDMMHFGDAPYWYSENATINYIKCGDMISLKTLNQWNDNYKETKKYKSLCSSCQTFVDWFFINAKPDEYFEGASVGADVTTYHLNIELLPREFDLENLEKPIILYCGNRLDMCNFLTNNRGEGGVYEKASPKLSYATVRNLYDWLPITYPEDTGFDFIEDVVTGVGNLIQGFASWFTSFIFKLFNSLIPNWLKVLIFVAIGIFIAFLIYRFIIWCIKMAKQPAHSNSKKRRR